MDGHQRCLPYAEGIEPQEHRQDPTHLIYMGGENAAKLEVRRPGNGVGPDNGRKQQPDRSRQKDAKINPPAIARFRVAIMRDQREGRKRQHFIEDEEREKVRRISNADGRRDRHRERHEEPGLMVFIMSAHIADRIDRVDQPKPRRNDGEHRAQWFGPELDRQPINDLDKLIARAMACPHRQKDGDGHDKDEPCGDQRRGFTQVWLLIKKPDRDKQYERRAEREHNSETGRDHCAPPLAIVIKACAARSAIPPVRSVRTPK